MPLAPVQRDACSSVVTIPVPNADMKTRFQVDRNAAKDPPPPALLVDPEAYDASEQQFAASLDEKPAKPTFILNEPAQNASKLREGNPPLEPEGPAACIEDPDQSAHGDDPASDQPPIENSDAWRRELQARLSQYRARKRPAPPRYPSLQLKFETTESWNNSSVPVQPPPAGADSEMPAQPAERVDFVQAGDNGAHAEADSPSPEPSGKLL
jgi:hypothetical protein